MFDLAPGTKKIFFDEREEEENVRDTKRLFLILNFNFYCEFCDFI